MLPPESADIRGQFMNVGYHENDSTEFINMAKLGGQPWFLGIGGNDPVPFKKIDLPPSLGEV